MPIAEQHLTQHGALLAFGAWSAVVRPRLPDLPEPPKFFENAVLPIGSGGIAQVRHREH